LAQHAVISVEDAEEYTQALGQVLAGGWRQRLLAWRLGVPQALGMTLQEWTEQRLGGYVRESVPERREAAAELREEGLSQREIGAVLGVSEATVNRDLNPVTNVTPEPELIPESQDSEPGSAPPVTNVTPEPETSPGLAGVEFDWDEPEDEPEDGEATSISGLEVEREEPKSSQLIQQSTENDWHTPSGYLAAVREVLGGIDLDPASSPAANATVGALRIYTKDQNGLAQPWRGRVWVNPPYGRQAGDFALRLCDEYATGNVTEAIILVNAHCTDTNWFQPLWDHTLCFTDHRIDFDAGGRTKKTSSTHGSVFIYLGPDPARFGKHFGQFGPVVRRI